MYMNQCTQCRDRYETENEKSETCPLCTVYTGYFIAPVAGDTICQPESAQAFILYGKEQDAEPTPLFRYEDPEAIWEALGECLEADKAEGHQPTVSYRDTQHGEIEAGEITFPNGVAATPIFCLWEKLTSLICDELPDRDSPDYRDDDCDNHPLAHIRDSGSMIANGLN